MTHTHMELNARCAQTVAQRKRGENRRSVLRQIFSQIEFQSCAVSLTWEVHSMYSRPFCRLKSPLPHCTRFLRMVAEPGVALALLG